MFRTAWRWDFSLYRPPDIYCATHLWRSATARRILFLIWKFRLRFVTNGTDLKHIMNFTAQNIYLMQSDCRIVRNGFIPEPDQSNLFITEMIRRMTLVISYHEDFSQIFPDLNCAPFNIVPVWQIFLGLPCSRSPKPQFLQEMEINKQNLKWSLIYPSANEGYYERTIRLTAQMPKRTSPM